MDPAAVAADPHHGHVVPLRIEGSHDGSTADARDRVLAAASPEDDGYAGAVHGTTVPVSGIGHG
jgi:hypothetical protein